MIFLEDILIVLFRTLLFYFIITFVYRLMGKREIGELSIMDLIVSILIAELAAISIDKHHSNIFISIITIGVLVILQMIMSKLSLKSNKFRNVIDGTPSIIINRGKINFKEMVKQRYNLDDLLTQLREQSIKNIEEVDYAILETNGKLSIFKKENNSIYPLPLILDGKLDEETLIQIQKDKDWLRRILNRNNVTIDEIFYAFYRNDNLFFIKKENVN